MRLPRMTTRRWMIAVVLAALLLGAVRLLMLSAAYRTKAGRYQLELLGTTPILMGPNGSHSRGYRPSARTRWAEKMGEKYLRASRFPWLPVEPDPPEPD
jgi:hypothetical protein